MIFKNLLKSTIFIPLIYLGFGIGINFIELYSKNDPLTNKISEIRYKKLKQLGLEKKSIKEQLLELNVENDRIIFIIGDSFMDNLFQFDFSSYHYLYKLFSKSINYKFVDLSKSGANLNYFDTTLKKVKSKNSILIYNFLEHDLYTSINKPKVQKLNYNNWFSVFELRGLENIKKILHKIHFYFYSEPFPFSSFSNKFNSSNLSKEKIFKDHITDVKNRFDKVYLIINLDFNYHYSDNYPKSFEFFESLSDSNLKIIFANKIIKNPSSISNLDGHPNKTSVKKIFDFVENEIKNEIKKTDSIK